jgi:hypothetical protein
VLEGRAFTAAVNDMSGLGFCRRVLGCGDGGVCHDTAGWDGQWC